MNKFKQRQELYKVSISTKKMQVWYGWTDGNRVFCSYGQLDGKMQEQVYSAEGKNLGRSNETTSEQQALIELEAMYQSQLDNKHYKLTQDEAVSYAEECREPRKITNYKDRYSKMSETLLTSIKKNGSRGCVLEGDFYSKIGRPEDIKVSHLRGAVEELGELATFDSEIYAEGLSLQRIRSAWLKPIKTDKEIIKVAKDRIKRVNDIDLKTIKTQEDAINYLGYNPNEDAFKLKFWVFDMPDSTNIPFSDRVKKMEEFHDIIREKKLDVYFEFLYPVLTHSHEERMELLDKVCEEGSEGLVHYEVDGVYEFGKRSTNTAKSKPRYDSECRVVEVTKDKGGDGVLHCIACNALENAKFKCKMKVKRRDGKEYPRDYETMLGLKGSWITFSYEDLSSVGIPCKPVGEEERDCDEEGNPLE